MSTLAPSTPRCRARSQRAHGVLNHEADSIRAAILVGGALISLVVILTLPLQRYWHAAMPGIGDIIASDDMCNLSPVRVQVGADMGRDLSTGKHDPLRVWLMSLPPGVENAKRDAFLFFGCAMVASGLPRWRVKLLDVDGASRNATARSRHS